MTSVVDSFISSYSHLNYDLGIMLSIIIISSGVIIFTIMALNAMVAVYFERKKFGDLLEKFAGYENGVMNAGKGYVNNMKFSKSPAMAPAHYFSGLALLATGKFNEAKPLLGAVVGANVTGLPVRDVSLDDSGKPSAPKTPKEEKPDANGTETTPEEPEESPGG